MITNALEIPVLRQEPVSTPSAFTWVEIAPDRTGWDALIRNGAGDMFQLSSLLMAHRRSGQRAAGILLQRPGRAPIAVGGLLHRARGRSRFQTLSFPALASTDEPELLCSLAEWLAARGIGEIHIGSFTGGAEGYLLPTAGVSTRQRLEFAWDLSLGAAERFRALRSTQRRKLQKLHKQNLVLKRIDQHQPAKMTWLRLQWGRRRDISFSLWHLLRTYAHYRTLHRHLTQSGIGHLYGLFDAEDRLLSSAYMLEVGGTAFYMLGASAPAGYQLSASLQLFWDLAEHYTDQGFRQLHLGGVPAAATSKTHGEHGVFRFKAGFGIEPISRMSLSIKNEE